jgi:hypothetical protein
MSHYEHENHAAYGFSDAESKSKVLADSAMAGECQHFKPTTVMRKARKEYIALIPFFGGRPTNGSNYWTDSLGHGNSIVSLMFIASKHDLASPVPCETV